MERSPLARTLRESLYQLTRLSAAELEALRAEITPGVTLATEELLDGLFGQAIARAPAVLAVPGLDT